MNTTLSIAPRIVWALMYILVLDKMMPTANTATVELAAARKSNDGNASSGICMPQTTKAVAAKGAHATGCESACNTACIVPEAVPEAAFNSDNPTGMPTALTTMPTMATIRPTWGVVPNSGCSTANPMNPIAGEPLNSAITAPSLPPLPLKQCLYISYTSVKHSIMPANANSAAGSAILSTRRLRTPAAVASKVPRLPPIYPAIIATTIGIMAYNIACSIFFESR